jgi:ribosomal protein L37AE/L43A
MTTALCTACEGPLTLLDGEDRRVCTDCDAQARRVVRRVLLNRERQRRWYRRHRKPNAPDTASVRSPLALSRPIRIVRGMEPMPYLRDRTEAPEREIPAIVEEKPSYCACGRALNLGRYKTGGDTCAKCKHEQARAAKPQPPMYASFEEVARQLEDTTPLPDDPYSETEDGDGA